tara:strand:+ start:1131 stop:1433 length:303 start_codon:yes stop_codon:yes gene_type:complete
MSQAVTVELVREVVDDNDVLIEEILITVDAQYCEGDPSVGLGEHVYSERAYLSDDKSRAPVDLTDEEEDALLSLYKEECDRVRDDMIENQWQSCREQGGL